MLINQAPMTCLQADATSLVYHFGGVFAGPIKTIHVEDVMSVKVDPRHPKYQIPAMIAVGLPMLAYGMVGRLTLAQFGAGFALVALCGVLASVQSTNNVLHDRLGEAPGTHLHRGMQNSRPHHGTGDCCTLTQVSRLKAQERAGRAGLPTVAQRAKVGWAGWRVLFERLRVTLTAHGRPV